MTYTSDMLNSGSHSPLGSQFYRASLLNNSNYFLTLFGQSDRQIVSHGKIEPTIPQSLNLLNGELVSVVTKPQSHLIKSLEKIKSKKEKAYFIYWSILTRPPTFKEASMAARFLNKGEKGIQDLVWILVNMDEFKFIQ